MVEQSSQPRTCPPRRRRCWHRWLVYKLVVILVLLGGGYWYIANPRRAASLAEGLLESVTAVSVNIEAAYFGLDGTIRLRQVELRLPGRRGETGRLFETEQVFIEHNAWSLLLGRFDPRVIDFKSVPVIYLTEDVAIGKFNFQLLQEEGPLTQRGPLPACLPEILLREGRVQFGQVEGGRYKELDSTLIQGKLVVDQSRPSLYSFTLVQKTLDAIPGAALTGTYDPQDQTFSAEIDRFTLAGPHRNWLPRDWRRWWDQYDPAGTMQKLRMGYHHRDREFFAEIRLEDVSLIPPYPPVAEAGVRMTGGSGTFTFYKDRIEIKDLRGRIEGISYEVNGKVLGYEDQAPFRLENRFEVTIPDRPRYLNVMPPSVVTLFRQIKPAGRFSASVLLERQDHGGKLAASGTVKVRDAEAEFQYFPYPLSHLRGEVQFEPGKVRILALSGEGPNGARLRIDGRIWPPGQDAGLDIYVAGQNVMLDDNLFQTISDPKRRLAIRRFLDPDGHAKLIESGLIQTTAQRAAIGKRLDEARARLERASEAERPDLDTRIIELTRLLACPVFDLGGRVSFKSHIERAPGVNTKPEFTTAVAVSGVNMLYGRWPYPLHLKGGMLVFAPGGVEAQELEGHGVNAESRLVASGEITVRDGKFCPELKLEGRNVPMDELLLASLNPARRKWLSDLGIRGRLDASCRVFTDEHGEIDFAMATQFEEGTARPFRGRYGLEGLSGRAILSRDTIKFEKFEARHGDSRMTFNGEVSRSEGRRVCTLQVEGRNLRFEDELLDLMPATHNPARRLHELVSRSRPSGLFDAALDLYMKDERPIAYRLELRPASIDFDLADRRIALSQVEGRAIVTPEKIVIDDAAATFDGERYAANGTVTLGADPIIGLTVRTASAGLERVGRAILPKAVNRVLDHLQFEGGYGIPEAKFVYRPQARDGLVLEFKGLVRLKDASARIGVPITKLNGDLHIEATYKPGQKWPRLDLRLEASRVRVEDRLISPLAMTISNVAHPRILKIDRVRGRCYDGIVMGSGQVVLDEHGEYEVDVIIQDARLGPLIEAAGSDSSPAESNVEKSGTRGLVSGTLAFKGRRGDPRTRQGRGEILVREANLYETPLSLAVLQLVNLTIPSAKAFDRASARFVLDGDRVLLDEIVFEAPRVRVSGYGTMDYSTRALDLDLVTSAPSAWDLGPLTDLVSLLKNELLSIHVGGTLKKPDAKVTRFRGAGQLLSRPKLRAIHRESRASSGHLPVDPQEASASDRPMTFGQ